MGWILGTAAAVALLAARRLPENLFGLVSGSGPVKGEVPRLTDWLARHIEMVPGRIHPIPDLYREGRILPFPMIEAILAGFGEPQLVDLAYGLKEAALGRAASRLKEYGLSP